MARPLLWTLGLVLMPALLATALVAQAAPKLATIEVKGMVCSA